MDATVAATIAHATRNQALDDARNDLNRLQLRAVEAGREESRRLVKVSHINRQTGQATYRPAGRVLRDWYLHCYLNGLRERLGHPSVVIDAQQIEDTAALLHRLAPETEPVQALRAGGVLRNAADADAAQATVTIMASLRSAAERRAIQHAPDGRFDNDQLRVHVTRHWYQRCYIDHVEAATRSQQPLTAVTGAEEHQVAVALASRAARQLVAADGTVMVTSYGTLTDDLDRAVARGQVGVVPSTVGRAFDAPGSEDMRTSILNGWSRASDAERGRWAREAGIADPILPPWDQLNGDHQNALVGAWLRGHGRPVQEVPFHGEPLDGPPAEAARLMFNHPRQLSEARSVATGWSDELGNEPIAARAERTDYARDTPQAIKPPSV